MIRTFKRKLNPTQQQAQRIVSWMGACRVVYNLGLEIKIAAYKNQGKYISAFELMKQLPDLKRTMDRLKMCSFPNLAGYPCRLPLADWTKATRPF
jgi:transposase